LNAIKQENIWNVATVDAKSKKIVYAMLLCQRVEKFRSSQVEARTESELCRGLIAREYCEAVRLYDGVHVMPLGHHSACDGRLERRGGNAYVWQCLVA
jgi:hypothetical protein